jgi:hypothetical protein
MVTAVSMRKSRAESVVTSTVPVGYKQGSTKDGSGVCELARMSGSSAGVDGR